MTDSPALPRCLGHVCALQISKWKLLKHIDHRLWQASADAGTARCKRRQRANGKDIGGTQRANVDAIQDLWKLARLHSGSEMHHSTHGRFTRLSV